MKENIKNTNKKFTKGFTLIELLVVVLIIGILAAIALPQYKIAVGKAKFAELKINTKAVNEAAQRYFLVQGKYPAELSDLDVDISTGCYIMPTAIYTMCEKYIFGVRISYYILKEGNKPHLCYVYNKDLSHPANILCAKEANRVSPNCYTGPDRCVHYY